MRKLLFADMTGKEIGTDLLVNCVAGVLVGIGMYNFAAAEHFPMTGCSGIAMILYHLFSLPIGIMTIVINIPIALFTYRLLGRKFFLKSLESMIVTSLFTDFFATQFPAYTGDRMLSAITCAVCCGIGYAMILMNGSSTGGMDFIALSLRLKFPHMTIGKLTFVFDIAVILCSCAFVPESRDIDSLIYGVIISYVMSLIIDKLMYGIDQGKVAMIISDCPHEICEAIADQFDRGATIIKGQGSFTGTNQEIVMCACNNKQMYGIRKLVKSMDPHSFTMILESSDVVGEGFKTE